MMIWEKYYKSLTKRICISAVVDIGGSKGGGRERLSLSGVQILSISCSVWENLAKSYVGAPPLLEGRFPTSGKSSIGAPPRGNPRSATG